jgi:chorismate synthase
LVTRQVAAGAIAEKWLREAFGVDIVAWVSGVGDICTPRALEEQDSLTRADVDRHPTRCPDLEKAEQMAELIRAFWSGSG